MYGAQYEAHVDEPARPEKMSSIRYSRAEIYRAGRILYCVVQKCKLTVYWSIPSVGQTNLGSERTFTHLLLHFCQIMLGDRKVSINRIQPLDYKQGIPIARRPI